MRVRWRWRRWMGDGVICPTSIPATVPCIKLRLLLRKISQCTRVTSAGFINVMGCLCRVAVCGRVSPQPVYMRCRTGRETWTNQSGAQTTTTWSTPNDTHCLLHALAFLSQFLQSHVPRSFFLPLSCTRCLGVEHQPSEQTVHCTTGPNRRRPPYSTRGQACSHNVF
jgi:hypothetical protein